MPGQAPGRERARGAVVCDSVCVLIFCLESGQSREDTPIISELGRDCDCDFGRSKAQPQRDRQQAAAATSQRARPPITIAGIGASVACRLSRTPGEFSRAAALNKTFQRARAR